MIDKNELDPKYDKNNEINQPKFVLDNVEVFTQLRRNLGNIVTKWMKCTGATDIDYFIEHNGHMIILELKTFHDHYGIVTKAQMYAFEVLFHNLKSCDFFFIFHKDIKFDDPNDEVWILSMKDWINKIKKTCDEKAHDYLIDIKKMQKIDVKILRDIIDTAWLSSG